MIRGLWGEDVRFEGSVFKNHYELATIIVYCIFFAGIIWAWSQIGKPSLRPGEGDIIAKSKGPFNRLASGTVLELAGTHSLSSTYLLLKLAQRSNMATC